MKKTFEYCDHCGEQVSYVDSDGDQESNGIRCEPVWAGTAAKIEDVVLSLRMHKRTSSGSTSAPMPAIPSKFIVCGPDCFEAKLVTIIAEVRTAWGPGDAWKPGDPGPLEFLREEPLPRRDASGFYLD